MNLYFSERGYLVTPTTLWEGDTSRQAGRSRTRHRSCKLPSIVSPQPAPTVLCAYFDESGDFDCNGDVVVVAGVVAPSRLPDAHLRSQLKQLAPGWPWPLHAAHLQYAVSFALGTEAAGRVDPTRAPTMADAARAAIRILRAKGHPVDEMVDGLVSGTRPDLESLRRSNRELLRQVSSGHAPAGVIARLMTARRQWRQGFTQFLRSIVGAWGVAAGETVSGGAGRAFVDMAGLDSFAPSPTHRYFGVLGQALVQTGQAATLMNVSPFNIDVRVATRGAHGMRGLTVDDLLMVDRRHRKEAMAWRSLHVTGFDGDAPSLLVAADVVSNAVRHIHRDHGWSAKQATLATGLMFPASTTGRP